MLITIKTIPRIGTAMMTQSGASNGRRITLDNAAMSEPKIHSATGAGFFMMNLLKII
jgi:hypothetical protein